MPPTDYDLRSTFERGPAGAGDYEMVVDRQGIDILEPAAPKPETNKLHECLVDE